VRRIKLRDISAGLMERPKTDRSIGGQVRKGDAMEQQGSAGAKIAPFLKWAGGKRWLTRRVEGLNLAEGTYFEPFLGSAAMFFHWRPRKAVLSDRNEALAGTYQAIKANPSKVVDYLRKHARLHSTEYYYRLREMRCRNDFSRAAQFIYLNRTCWNGLYRVNRDGIFNVPKGTKTNVLLDEDDFTSVAELLKGSEIFSSDFEVQIDKAQNGDVIFADPPYTVRHNFNGFVKYNEVLFSWDDQVRLRNALLRAKERGAKVLLTNADHESIRSLYADGFVFNEIARYSAISSTSGSRGKYSELLIS